MKPQLHQQLKITVLLTLLCSLLAGNTTLAMSFSAKPKVTEETKELLKKSNIIVNKALDSKDPVIQMHAIEVIATANITGLMPKVTKKLSSELAPVRFAAAMAMGDTKYKPGEYALKKTIEDPDTSVRMATAYALSKLGDPSHERIIIEGIQSQNQTAKANGAMIMGKLRNPKYNKLLHWMLKDENTEDKVKIQAIESLAMLKDKGMYQKAWSLLISKRADDKVMGIKILRVIGDYQSAKSIKTMLSVDNVLEVRLTAAENLGAMGDKAGEAEVLYYFTNISPTLNKIDRTRANIHATLAIGQIRTEETLKYLPKLLSDNSEVVRLHAAQSVFFAYKMK